MKDLRLNYSELAFIMNKRPSEIKEKYLKYLSVEKCGLKDLIEVEILKTWFDKPIKSNDNRYDGLNELLFNLEHKSELYKKFLTNKSMIKNKRFTAGKTIFYKICSEEQLQHAKEVFNYKYEYMFGNK